MEDRLTPVLYLEMTDATPDDYARDRVGDVLAMPGVERATWWRNVYRDRPDLPASCRSSTRWACTSASHRSRRRPRPPA